MAEYKLHAFAVYHSGFFKQVFLSRRFAQDFVKVYFRDSPEVEIKEVEFVGNV